MAASTASPPARDVPAGCPHPGAHGVRYPVVFVASNRPDFVASARMSFEEFLDLDYEDGLAEWVDGEVFLYMSVKLAHDRVPGPSSLVGVSSPSSLVLRPSSG
ncbi:MAG: hypothetical protein ACKVVT_11100 [Dehalococcoidia bacterium]